MQTDSAVSPQRSSLLLLPNTFWVLMLRIRIGASAVLKLMRLMAAMRMIRKAMLVSSVMALRLPLLRYPQSE